jgi:hypothetical protein
MQINAKRTLVRSAPELWLLADDHQRLGSWMSDLVGGPGSMTVEVTAREQEQLLAWRATATETPAEIRIEFADSGFGTVVEITAEHTRADASAASSALEGVLDELGSPERRPFVSA